jgi:methanethiol oxidase
MARLTPDPTFYPTARDATAAPPEALGYVATIDVSGNGGGRPDTLGVVDLDPASSSYGEIVARVEMPNVGDELHHFGWNACSSALCPWMPHPHVERRYLVARGCARRGSTCSTRRAMRASRRS